MEIRPAQLQDRPAIRDVARRSLQASYSLEPRAITGAIRKWYDEDRLESALAEDQKVILVGELDGQVIGFSESIISSTETAQLLWLHIDPFHRGADYGEQLFDATREQLADRGITTIQGHVLADNTEGADFYEEQGLSKVGEEEVDIDGETHVEYIFADIENRGIEDRSIDGETMYVDFDTVKSGSFDSFHPIYTDAVGEELYGHWCGNCASAPVAMDTMGKLQCNDCGNESKPTRWDAAYL